MRRNKRARITRVDAVPWLLISPLLLLYLLLPGWGLVNTIIESTGYIPALGLTVPGTDAYRSILADPGFFGNLLFSLYTALTATVLSTILGVALSYILSTSRTSLLRNITLRLLQTGLVMPYLYVVFLAVLFLSRTGVLSRILYLAGILEDYERFPALVFDKEGKGIILSFVFKGTPFVTLFTVNIMSRISTRFGDVARTLSVHSVQRLFKIYLPLSAKAIVWSSSILLVYSIGSFEVPYFLGVLTPESLSAQAFSIYLSPDIGDIPLSMAMNSMIFFISIACVSLYAALLRFLLSGRWRGR